MIKKNKILLGDSLKIMKTIPSQSIDLIFADPPYNLQLKDTLYRPDQTTVEAVTQDWDKFNTYKEYDNFTEQWLKESKRISFENENIKGTISLVGGIIDDLTFKKYTTSVDSNEKITLLNPKEIETGYYIDSGWAINNNEIEAPNSKTIWNVEGNNKLNPNSPVKLVWKNDDNIKFEKKIDLEEIYKSIIKIADYLTSFSSPVWKIINEKAHNNQTILFEGAPSLRNQYGIIMVNPNRHKHVKSTLASKFISWMTGKVGQSAINRFRINGKQSFFANAAG